MARLRMAGRTHLTEVYFYVLAVVELLHAPVKKQQHRQIGILTIFTELNFHH
ncbi:hypothetical protein O7623_10580 [Solwaraspora sp. WMMD791]|uniref:hypothetical protein n=1 Tax=Solwaraspora sp. WMMD791 TaxID=3016086 RepID=UPI002499DFF8|nr:hypothetical protein [Solwaraspora sp. WMMD791]WFE29595.1 hypothetical protein O7623_10580 [Solwaraspora sp. WMMD791]